MQSTFSPCKDREKCHGEHIPYYLFPPFAKPSIQHDLTWLDNNGEWDMEHIMGNAE